jgi:hypothetical protein
MSESFYLNLSFSGPAVLEKKIFKYPTLILQFWDYRPLEEKLVLF